MHWPQPIAASNIHHPLRSTKVIPFGICKSWTHGLPCVLRSATADAMHALSGNRYNLNICALFADLEIRSRYARHRILTPIEYKKSVATNWHGCNCPSGYTSNHNRFDQFIGMIVNPFKGITTYFLVVGAPAEAPGSLEPFAAPATV